MCDRKPDKRLQTVIQKVRKGPRFSLNLRRVEVYQLAVVTDIEEDSLESVPDKTGSISVVVAEEEDHDDLCFRRNRRDQI